MPPVPTVHHHCLQTNGRKWPKTTDVAKYLTSNMMTDLTSISHFSFKEKREAPTRQASKKPPTKDHRILAEIRTAAKAALIWLK